MLLLEKSFSWCQTVSKKSVCLQNLTRFLFQDGKLTFNPTFLEWNDKGSHNLIFYLKISLKYTQGKHLKYSGSKILLRFNIQLGAFMKALQGSILKVHTMKVDLINLKIAFSTLWVTRTCLCLWWKWKSNNT